MTPDIKAIQQILASYGFSPGPIDGAWGPASQRALVTALQAGLAHASSQPPGQCDEDAALFLELDEDEGVVSYAYPDSKGYLTIGRGRLVDKRRGGGLSRDEIDYLSRNDLRHVDQLLDAHIPWWRDQTAVRRRALRNLMFNMGWGDGEHGLSGFRNTLAAWQAGDYDRAAAGLLASQWATDVQPARRDRIIRQVRKGV